MKKHCFKVSRIEITCPVSDINAVRIYSSMETMVIEFVSGIFVPNVSAVFIIQSQQTSLPR